MRLLAALLLFPAFVFAEPLASVNNLNPLTSDSKFNVQVAPLDAAGNRIDALLTTATWTFQQQTIQVSIPAQATPYVFTGLHIWYRVESGTGIVPIYWGAFQHKQAAKNVAAGLVVNCVYAAPTLTAGDLTCTPGLDTVSPSSPGALTATVASTTGINLAWTAATDNVGVTAYGIERCLGMGCTAAFALIGTTAGTAFSDTGLASGQTYSYRVRANDAANNFGAYSNLAVASTPVPVPPPVCVRIPPSSPVAGEVTDFSSKMTDSVGAVWTIAPRTLGADTVTGQVAVKRNGVQQFGGIEYAYMKGTGAVCVADFKSGPGVSCFDGTKWNQMAGSAACP